MSYIRFEPDGGGAYDEPTFDTQALRGVETIIQMFGIVGICLCSVVESRTFSLKRPKRPFG